MAKAKKEKAKKETKNQEPTRVPPDNTTTYGGADTEPRGNTSTKLGDVIVQAKLAPEYQDVRFLGLPSAYTLWWIPIVHEGKVLNIPRVALGSKPNGAWDAEEEDPYEEIAKDKFPNTHFWCNAILRSEQTKKMLKNGCVPTKEERKNGYLIPGKSKTPVQVIRLPKGAMRDIQEIAKTYKRGDIASPKDGCDLAVLYNEKPKSPRDYWKIQRGEPSPLSKHEREYLLYDTASLYKMNTLKAARKDADKLREQMDKPPKKSKKGKGKKRAF